MVYCTPLCGVPWAPESCLGTQHCMGLPCPSTENGKAYSSTSKDIKCISFTEVICVNRVDQINNPDWEGGERHGIYLPQEGEGLSCESIADKTMVYPSLPTVLRWAGKHPWWSVQSRSTPFLMPWFLLKLAPTKINIRQWVLLETVITMVFALWWFSISLFPSTFIPWSSSLRETWTWELSFFPSRPDVLGVANLFGNLWSVAAVFTL